MVRFSSLGTNKSQLTVISVGAQTTKCVAVQHHGKQLKLRNYLLKETPTFPDTRSVANWTAFFKDIKQQIGVDSNRLVLVLGMEDAVFRHAIIPEMPLRSRQ